VEEHVMVLELSGERSRPLRAGAVALAALMALGGAALWLRAGRAPADEAISEAVLARASFQEATGVRVTRVAVVGGGGLIDLRYQVIDPDKAEAIHLTPPVLVDERSGEVIVTLFMGHRHSSEPKAGYTYPLIFINERGLLAPGSAVSVLIGDELLEHVTVR
jgi:hypothetical protein